MIISILIFYCILLKKKNIKLTKELDRADACISTYKDKLENLESMYSRDISPLNLRDLIL